MKLLAPKAPTPPKKVAGILKPVCFALKTPSTIKKVQVNADRAHLEPELKLVRRPALVLESTADTLLLSRLAAVLTAMCRLLALRRAKPILIASARSTLSAQLMRSQMTKEFAVVNSTATMSALMEVANASLASVFVSATTSRKLKMSATLIAKRSDCRHNSTAKETSKSPRKHLLFASLKMLRSQKSILSSQSVHQNRTSTTKQNLTNLRSSAFRSDATMARILTFLASL